MKRILTTLCALAIVMAGSVPALAAESTSGQSANYYPISVEEYTYGSFDEPRIEKVYQLSLSDDPSGIPTEDFVRNGRLYYLLDMTRENEIGVDIPPSSSMKIRSSWMAITVKACVRSMVSPTIWRCLPLKICWRQNSGRWTHRRAAAAWTSGSWARSP